MTDTQRSVTAASLHIDGKSVHGHGESMPVLDPSNGEVVATINEATSDDLQRAVLSADRAFSEWSHATPAERSGVLTKLALLLDQNANEFAQLESRNAGKPIRLANEFDVPGTIDNIAYFAGAARQLEGTATGEYAANYTSSIRREPIGVIGSISPWNYPLQMAAWKMLPAVAAGNTIVLKPAEVTPLTTLRLAELAAEAGMPPGVFNVVTGKGSTIGAELVAHPKVGMVSFTGSTGVGRQIMASAASTAKRVHLELGGKAPFVVFDDADLEAAIHGAVAGSLINSGQDCTAATRAIVHRSLYDEFVSGVADLYRSVQLGPTSDTETDQGPLISRAHQKKVAGMVERARGSARIVVGGQAPMGELSRGSYFEPTLIVDVDSRSEIAREEVFGPVLTVMAFDDDDEGLRLANDSIFGLAASAWTTNTFRALRASSEIRAGTVWLNDHIPIISEMPHGGMKQSGFGKDMSRYALDEYTIVKHVMHERSGAAVKDWHRTVFAGGGWAR